jgi:hypothetical protein
MSIEPIGIVTLLAGLLSLACGLRFAAFALAFSTLLGASAALILSAMGNANVQPAHLLLAFFIATAATHKDLLRGVVACMRFPKPGFWLTLTGLCAIVSAYYLPRLFSGLTDVFGLRTDSSGYVVLTPLAPSSGNLTQPVYFIGDVICFLAMSAYARSGSGKRVVAQAILFCAVANLAFAALDLATSATNTTELFSPIRNATYRLLDDADSIGMKRIVGSFSEASAFGFATLGFFAFATQLWLEGVYRRIALPIAMLSLVALTLSTSTTAYVGLAIFLLLTLTRCISRAAVARATPQAVAFILVTPLTGLMLAAVILFNDHLSAYAQQAMDTVLFDKMSSSSGIERSAWNAQALQNFFDTYGLGAGVGSLRASSLVLAVLGSMGIPGAVLYGAFLGSVFWRTGRTDQPSLSAAFQSAARSACLALLIAAALTSALIDLGLPFFLLAALASADPDPSPARPVRIGTRTA